MTSHKQLYISVAFTASSICDVLNEVNLTICRMFIILPVQIVLIRVCGFGMYSM